MARDRILVGRAAIADAMGCSEKTVSRHYHTKTLPAFKTGRTSPLKIAVRDLQKYLKGK